MERTNEREKSFRFGDWGPKYIFRGPQIEWGLLILKEGTELGKHLHNTVEETFYFLEGQGKIIINDTEYNYAQGDAFRIEPKESHNIIPSKLTKAIFIKAPFNPEDKVKL